MYSLHTSSTDTHKQPKLPPAYCIQRREAAYSHDTLVIVHPMCAHQRRITLTNQLND